MRQSGSNSGGKPSFSRAVHQDNTINKKRGISVAHLQSASVPSKLTKKPRKAPVQKEHKKTLVEQKQEQALKDAVAASKKARSSETHFSIPNVDTNNNLLAQTYIWTHAKHAVLINEIKTRSKVAQCAEDFEHIALK